jgi:hypothetical protein
MAEGMVMNFKSTASWQIFRNQGAIRLCKAPHWCARALLYTLILFLCLGHSCGYWAEPMRATPPQAMTIMDPIAASTVGYA